jgi:(S)-ureidoglycine aminohydrolase
MFTLIRPGNHYASRLPNLPGAQVVKLVTPRVGPARFAEYLVLGANGAIQDSGEFESFAYDLDTGAFLYAPAHSGVGLGPRLLWLKRRYEPWPGLAAPQGFAGDARTLDWVEAAPGLHRRELIPPDDPAFDFNMSLLRFDPGAGLPQIEIHDEEHGLYMTAGSGSYHLYGNEHDVSEGDFIYMAPYCPQGFLAGPDGAEYLLYKDVYRDGF